MKFRSFFNRQLLRSTAPGFSLAEVLIAIVIITILTIGSLAVYSSQIAKARDTERVNDITRIKGALDVFIGDYGLPPNPDINNARRIRNAEIKTTCTGASLYDCFKLIGASSDTDLYEMLTDPSQGIKNNQVSGDVRYGYLYVGDENSYKICAMLENQGSKLLNYNYEGTGASEAGGGDNIYCEFEKPAGVDAANSVEKKAVVKLPEIEDIPGGL